jgi:hypothetical protein
MSYQDVAYTPGSGGLAKVDRIGGSDIPRLKLGLGAEGTAVDAEGGAGAANAGTLRTVSASNDPAVTALASILAKIIAAPATEAKQDTLIAKDFATQTTLAAVLAKLSADPATQTTLAAILAALGSTLTVTGTVGANTGLAQPLTDSQLRASAVPVSLSGVATEAKQDALIAKDFATQTTLAAVLAKIIAAPATEAKQDTLIAKDFATQTTLAAILAKIIAAPATEAKQDTAIGHLATLAAAIIAHDAVDSGNPVKVGNKAVAGVSGATLVAANDRTNAYAGLDGVPYVRPHCGLEDIVSGNASNTDGASTEVIAAGGSGIKQYLTKVVLTNMHASSTVYVEMKSGTTVKATLPCPPGGGTFSFDPPLPPNAANEAWNFDPSAATTTIYCTAVAFKSKI